MTANLDWHRLVKGLNKTKVADTLMLENRTYLQFQMGHKSQSRFDKLKEFELIFQHSVKICTFLLE